MAPAVHPKRASLPLPGGSDGAGVTVTPMRTAEMLTQPRFFQRPSGALATARGLGLLTPKSKWTLGSGALLPGRAPDRGHFLIDTELPPAASHDVRAALGRRARSSTTSAWRPAGRSPISSSGWASTRWASTSWS